jgi:hypothetical protein
MPTATDPSLSSSLPPAFFCRPIAIYSLLLLFPVAFAATTAVRVLSSLISHIIIQVEGGEAPRQGRGRFKEAYDTLWLGIVAERLLFHRPNDHTRLQ